MAYVHFVIAHRPSWFYGISCLLSRRLPPPTLILHIFFGFTLSLWTDPKANGSGNVVHIPQGCAWQRPVTHGMDLLPIPTVIPGLTHTQACFIKPRNLRRNPVGQWIAHRPTPIAVSMQDKLCMATTKGKGERLRTFYIAIFFSAYTEIMIFVVLSLRKSLLL